MGIVSGLGGVVLGFRISVTVLWLYQPKMRFAPQRTPISTPSRTGCATRTSTVLPMPAMSSCEGEGATDATGNCWDWAGFDDFFAINGETACLRGDQTHSAAAEGAT